MKWLVGEGEDVKNVHVHREDGQDWRVAIDDYPKRDVRVSPAGPNRWLLEMEGQRYLLNAKLVDGVAYIQTNGWNLRVPVRDPRNNFMGGSDTASQGHITTQMPGVIVRTLAMVGDSVQKGQSLIVVEAMKMENELKAPMDGVVAAVHVEDGQAVDSGTLLIEVSELTHEA